MNKKEIMLKGDAILTERKKDINHITTQLDKNEHISYNTGFHSGFAEGYSLAEAEITRLKELLRKEVEQTGGIWSNYETKHNL